MKKLIITACIAAGSVGASAQAMNMRTTPEMTSAQIAQLAREELAKKQQALLRLSTPAGLASFEGQAEQKASVSASQADEQRQLTRSNAAPLSLLAAHAGNSGTILESMQNLSIVDEEGSEDHMSVDTVVLAPATASAPVSASLPHANTGVPFAHYTHDVAVSGGVYEQQPLAPFAHYTQDTVVSSMVFDAPSVSASLPHTELATVSHSEGKTPFSGMFVQRENKKD